MEFIKASINSWILEKVVVRDSMVFKGMNMRLFSNMQPGLQT